MAEKTVESRKVIDSMHEKAYRPRDGNSALIEIQQDPSLAIELPRAVPPIDTRKMPLARKRVLFFAAATTQKEREEAKTTLEENVSPEIQEEALTAQIGPGLEAIADVKEQTLFHEYANNEVQLDKLRIPKNGDQIIGNDGESLNELSLTPQVIKELINFNPPPPAKRTLEQIVRNADAIIHSLYGETGTPPQRLDVLIKKRVAQLTVTFENREPATTADKALKSLGKESRQLILESTIKIYLANNPQDAQKVLKLLETNNGKDLLKELGGKNSTVLDSIIRKRISEALANPSVRDSKYGAILDTYLAQPEGSLVPKAIRLSGEPKTEEAFKQWTGKKAVLFKGIVPDGEISASEKSGNRLLELTANAMQENPKRAYEILGTMGEYIRPITYGGDQLNRDFDREVAERMALSEQTANKLGKITKQGGALHQLKYEIGLLSSFDQSAEMMQKALLIKAINHSNALSAEQKIAYEREIKAALRVRDMERLDSIVQNFFLVEKSGIDNKEPSEGAISNIYGYRALRILIGQAIDQSKEEKLTPIGRDRNFVENLRYFAFEGESQTRAQTILYTIILAENTGKSRAVNESWKMYRDRQQARHISEILTAGNVEEGLGILIGKKYYKEEMTKEEQAIAEGMFPGIKEGILEEIRRLKGNAIFYKGRYGATRILKSAIHTNQENPITSARLKMTRHNESSKEIRKVKDRLKQLTVEEEHGPSGLVVMARRTLLNREREYQSVAVTDWMNAVLKAHPEGLKGLKPEELDQLTIEVQRLRTPNVFEVLKSSSAPRILKQMVIATFTTVGITMAISAAPALAPWVAVGSAVVTVFGAVTTAQQIGRAEKQGSKKGVAAVTGVLGLGTSFLAGLNPPLALGARIAMDFTIEIWKLFEERRGQHLAIARLKTMVTNQEKSLKAIMEMEMFTENQLKAVAGIAQEVSINRKETIKAIIKNRQKLAREGNLRDLKAISEKIKKIVEETPGLVHHYNAMREEPSRAFKEAQQEMTKAEATAVAMFCTYQIGKIVGATAAHMVTIFSTAVQEINKGSIPYREQQEQIHILESRMQATTHESGFHIENMVRRGDRIYAVVDLPDGTESPDFLMQVIPNADGSFTPAFEVLGFDINQFIRINDNEPLGRMLNQINLGDMPFDSTNMHIGTADPLRKGGFTSILEPSWMDLSTFTLAAETAFGPIFSANYFYIAGAALQTFFTWDSSVALLPTRKRMEGNGGARSEERRRGRRDERLEPGERTQPENQQEGSDRRRLQRDTTPPPAPVTPPPRQTTTRRQSGGTNNAQPLAAAHTRQPRRTQVPDPALDRSLLIPQTGSIQYPEVTDSKEGRILGTLELDNLDDSKERATFVYYRKGIVSLVQGGRAENNQSKAEILIEEVSKVAYALESAGDTLPDPDEASNLIREIITSAKDTINTRIPSGYKGYAQGTILMQTSDPNVIVAFAPKSRVIVRKANGETRLLNDDPMKRKLLGMAKDAVNKNRAVSRPGKVLSERQEDALSKIVLPLIDTVETQFQLSALELPQESLQQAGFTPQEIELLTTKIKSTGGFLGLLGSRLSTEPGLQYDELNLEGPGGNIGEIELEPDDEQIIVINDTVGRYLTPRKLQEALDQSPENTDLQLSDVLNEVNIKQKDRTSNLRGLNTSDQDKAIVIWNLPPNRPRSRRGKRRVTQIIEHKGP